MEVKDSTVQLPFQAQEHLQETFMELGKTAKWIKLLAIVGFVFIGILCLAGLVMMFSSPMGFIFTVVFFLLSTILFFPLRYLYLYALGIQKHGESGSMTILEEAFDRQKALWIYCGIVQILYLITILRELAALAYSL
jgi:hypothetical protein